MVHDLIKSAALRTGVSVLAMAFVAGAALAQDDGGEVMEEDFVVTDGTGEAGEDIILIDPICIECSGGVDEGWVDGEVVIGEDGEEIYYDPDVVYLFDSEGEMPVEEPVAGGEEPELVEDGEVMPTAVGCENRMCESSGIEPNWRGLDVGNDSGPTHRQMREADPFPGVEVPNICLSAEFYVPWLCDWQMANQDNW